MANKVNFGLKNVHYALLTYSGTTPVFATPVAVEGAVSLELSIEGNTNTFYADNIAYYKSVFNNGYSGSLEMAKIPTSMLSDVWGYTVTATDKVIAEDATAEPAPFALLFQIEGDDEAEYYCFYRVIAQRPSVGSVTMNENGAEPQTQSFDIACLPLIDTTASSAIDGKVLIKTDSATDAAVKAAWFNAVYVAMA